MADQTTYRVGLRLALATIAWTAITCSVEVVLGVEHRVLSLIAFGLAGLLDAAGSVAVAVSFRHALHHDELADHHERRALRIIGTGMIVIGSLAGLESFRRLVTGARSDHSTLGVLIAIGSVLALTALSIAKRRVGTRANSESLLADATISAAGAALAAVAVIGASLGGHDSTWWVDAAAALAIAMVTVRLGARVASGQ